jgi:hypothetical protein
MIKKTLLDVVREYGIFEVKDVIERTGKSRQTLQNWAKNDEKFLRIMLLGLQAESKK